MRHQHSRCNHSPSTAPQILPSPPLNAGFIRNPTTHTISPKCDISTNATAHLAVTTTIFTVSTAYVALLGVLMIFFPSWSRTRQVIASPWSIAPIAVAYGILLCWSWQPDTLTLILPGNLADGFKGGFQPQFFPTLAGIVTLFSRVATAASLWVHILSINLFAAREIFLDGLDAGISTRHTIFLCLTLAPLGAACHALSKEVCKSRSRSRRL